MAKSGAALALVLVAAAVQAIPATPQQTPPTQQPPSSQPPATTQQTPPQQPPAPTPPQPPVASADVAAVARANGRTEAEVRRLFTDPSVRVGPRDKIFYVDPEPAEKAAGAAVAPQAAPFPYPETFLLHSRPGSQRVIYLDFDGHQVTGTAWTGYAGAPNDFFANEFSLDTSPFFSTVEQDVVQSVWQRVSEDFAPFDVDVTTQDPGAAAITRNGTADQLYGTRVLITNTPTISTGCGCGGVAYLDVFDEPFDHAYYQPAFVFASKLSYDTKNIAEASSHEAGHNFDLVHDGASPPVNYYGGHGAWAPIMGVSYNRPLTQWSKGEYTGANSSLQDDLAAIAANGAPLLADDHGNTSDVATALGASPTVVATGVITTDADVDVFRVDASAGVATFAAVPATVSPDLDIALELRDSTGAVVAANDPPSATVSRDAASGLSASVSTTLPAAGAYFLFVSGTGAANPATTGYSGYGSLGRYSVSGTVVTNDSFASPAPLSSPTGTVAGTNVGASKEPGEADHGGDAGGKSVWFRWTAPANGVVTLDTFGSTFDTLLGVYTGAGLDSLTAVAGNDDSDGGQQSKVTFGATSGTTYHMAVDGYGAASGTIALHWNQAPPPPPPTLAVGDVSVMEGNTGPTPATFTITRSGDPSGTSAVWYRTLASGTASAASDYAAVPAALASFGPGETTKAVTVNVTGDLAVEGDEVFYLALWAPTGAILTDTTGVGQIGNDDVPATLAVDDVSVAEGNAGPTPATFTITRSGSASGTSAVWYRTLASGTASAASDYAAVPAALASFGPGETTKTVTVNVTGDLAAEADEAFSLALWTPTGATLTDSVGAGQIRNDDTPATLAVDDVSVAEGDAGPTPATFTITRSGSASATSAVWYRTLGSGTASAASDYTAVPATLIVFGPGETTKAVTVNVTGDLAVEGDEVFYLALWAPTGATLTDTTGVGQIGNDDPGSVA